MRSLPHRENERERSVDDFWSCLFCNEHADRLQTVITEILATFTGKTDRDTLPAPCSKSASTERQRLLVVYLG